MAGNSKLYLTKQFCRERRTHYN